MKEEASGHNYYASAATQLKQFGIVFFGCLTAGMGIGFLQGVCAFWREDFQYMLFLAVLAAIAGGAIGVLEGLALYLCTHRYLRFEDYRVVACIALAGGCFSAGLLGMVGAGMGSVFITPLLTLVATIKLFTDRYRRHNRLR